MTKSFPDYQLKSGWNALLPAREVQPALREKRAADVVIIGAGFTGLACARRWQKLSPQARVVVIDASEIGEGNPGRNSGFLLDVALAEDAKPDNMQRMLECNRLTQEAMQSIVRDVEASGQAVDLQRAGTYRAAASAAGVKSLENYKLFLESAGLPYRQLDQASLEKELGTGFFKSGLFSPDCYLAQPASVIRAIHQQLPGSVTVYENTPALKISKTGNNWLVNTPEGELTCAQLVLANNSFAKNLGINRSRLVGVYTYAGITPRLPDSVLDTLGSNPNWGLLPAHRLGSTLRRTADGRLLVRSLHSYEQESAGQKVRQQLQYRMWRRFPQLKGQDFEHVWGGAVGITYNGAPVWGKQAPGLYVSTGCNGGGTVKGTMLGATLADLAHGNKVPDINSLFGSASWMPPDPLRSIGFHLTAALESWQGRKER